MDHYKKFTKHNQKKPTNQQMKKNAYFSLRLENIECRGYKS